MSESAGSSVRIAVMSDIHGNSIALDAVLKDIDTLGGADEHWVVGDIVALGHDPIGVLERLVALPGLVAVRGNTDRYVTTSSPPRRLSQHAVSDPSLLPTAEELAASFAWTEQRLVGTTWRRWLADLPLEHRVVLMDGTRVLAVHASPGRDDGPGIDCASSDDELASLIGICDADIVLTGHTHVPVDRVLPGIRAINTGSVSNPRRQDLRASYVILDADPAAYTIAFRRVAYDHEAVISRLDAVEQPAQRWLIAHQRGLVG